MKNSLGKPGTSLPAITVSSSQTGVRIDLRVIPKSPRTKIDGVRDGRLLVRVTAPPVDDAANDAVVEALSRVLDVPKRSIRIVSGATARNKTVEVAGMTCAAVLARLPV
jgi:uncharacterized protein (TIGR00251 family)